MAHLSDSVVAWRRIRRRGAAAVVATIGSLTALALAVSGCARPAGPSATTGPSGDTRSSTGAVAPGDRTSPTVPSSATPRATGPQTVVTPRATGPQTVVTGLRAPWGVAFLPDGSALVSQRDDATVLRIRPEGAGTTVSDAGKVAGVVPGGEGGLLGLAVPPGDTPSWVYAYLTAAQDNRVVRLRWDGRRLGAAEPVLTGIPKAGIHNGGRIAFGPDGYLYVATGDAGDGSRAQDPTSLGGKILRITSSGRPAPGNPDPGSPVWSLGHRNVQGLAFDGQGRLWAAEFGARDVDEVNLVRAGANYGWPQCEGACRRTGLVDPVVQWSPTDTASPSGIAWADGSLWVASLRGRVLYRVPLRGEVAAGQPQRLLDGTLGRLRTVVVAPDGRLWVTTSNTDGRGTPADGDDRIVALTP